jgi:hypothetical protein
VISSNESMLIFHIVLLFLCSSFTDSDVHYLLTGYECQSIRYCFEADFFRVEPANIPTNLVLCLGC